MSIENTLCKTDKCADPTIDDCDPSNRFPCKPGIPAIPGCSVITNPWINGEDGNPMLPIMDGVFEDLINSRGIPVEYFINTFNVEEDSDLLYGEHPTAPFYGPIPLMMYIELEDPAITLNTFGYDIDDMLTANVHIQTFYDTMKGIDNGIVPGHVEIFNRIQYDKPHLNNNQAIEPKAGDLIRVSMMGCTRPGRRGAPIFEITMATDQSINKINPLMGSYIWQLQAKRYDYSFEPGMPFPDYRAPQELGNEQVYDNASTGVISADIPGDPIFDENGNIIIEESEDGYMRDEVSALSAYSSPDKNYNFDVDEESKEKVYDQSVNDTDIYGGYY